MIERIYIVSAFTILLHLCFVPAIIKFISCLAAKHEETKKMSHYKRIFCFSLSSQRANEVHHITTLSMY
jgi:hypothetical protein